MADEKKKIVGIIKSPKGTFTLVWGKNAVLERDGEEVVGALRPTFDTLIENDAYVRALTNSPSEADDLLAMLDEYKELRDTVTQDIEASHG